MSDTLRVNYEFNQKVNDMLVKPALNATISMGEFLLRNDKKASETTVTGGTWDENRRVYKTTDSNTGVITEYKVSKNMRVESGFSVQEKSFKMIDGNKVQVEYDPKQGEWVKVNLFKKVADATPANKVGQAMRPTLMGNLVETKMPDGQTSFSLRIEKAKLKPALA